jgi:hypothetical protein
MLPSCRPVPVRVTVLLAVSTLVLAAPAWGQDVILDRVPIDVTVLVLDAESREPVHAERVLVREPGPVTTTVADQSDVAGEITFRGLMLYNYKPYTVSVWVDGVVYHAQQTGQAFLDGEPAILHAFAQTDQLDGLVIEGMNVIVREREGGFGLEYVLRLENRSRPQRTITAAALPVRLVLPPGLQRTEVEISRGPDPLTAALQPTGDGLHGVPVDLPPGSARVTVRGFVAGERIELGVGTNLPVEAWSLLAWPAVLEVRSFDLQRDRDTSYPEFARWRGPTLAANQRVTATVGWPQVVGADTTAVEAVPGPAGAPPPPRRSFPWLPVLGLIVVVVAYGLWRRRA